MIVLLVLLVLTNLWFVWADNSMTPSTQDQVIQSLESIKRQEEEKKKTCEEVKRVLSKVASKRKWITEDGRIILPDGGNGYRIDDCTVRTYVQVGTLSPANPASLTRFTQGTITKEDVKFQVDVGLFRTLFLMLMYAAGIFWAVRTAQRLIAGDLTESFINFFIGFIIVATIYVLYRWMPA